MTPSLPGYGFSDKPTARGWGIPHIAKAWAELMKRLAQGHNSDYKPVPPWDFALTRQIVSSRHCCSAPC